MGVHTEVYTESLKDVNEKNILALPQFFVVGEDLGKPLSRLHKTRCRIGEVTGLQQLSIPVMPLETIASTQKVLADGVLHREGPLVPL